MSERIGRLNLWLFSVGSNLTICRTHLPGLKGMTRRIYAYPAGGAGRPGLPDRGARRGRTGIAPPLGIGGLAVSSACQASALVSDAGTR